jgi:ATP-binding cassette, subfamily F, member 3
MLANMSEYPSTDKKLVYFKGSFEEWEWSVEEKQKRFGRLKEVCPLFILSLLDIADRVHLKLEDKKKKHIAATIQKNVQQARATGDDKRLGMVASRKKVRIHNRICRRCTQSRIKRH